METEETKTVEVVYIHNKGIKQDIDDRIRVFKTFSDAIAFLNHAEKTGIITTNTVSACFTCKIE